MEGHIGEGGEEAYLVLGCFHHPCVCILARSLHTDLEWLVNILIPYFRESLNLADTY